MGIPAKIEHPDDVGPGQSFGAPRAVGGHGHDETQHGELRGLNLQRPQTEPAFRAQSARAHPRRQHGQQGHDGQGVDQHAHRFEAPVVDQGHHHHGGDAQQDEDALSFQEVVRIETLGDQDPPGGRVDHDHPDRGHHDGGRNQDHVDAENLTAAA